MLYPLLNKAIFERNNEAIRLAKRNLNLNGFAGKKRKTNNTKKLSDGLGFRMNERDGVIITVFTSKQDYGKFIEVGVDGTKKNVGGEFKFKSKYVNIQAITDYIKTPKIKLRKTLINKNGQKVSKLVPKNAKNIKSAAFAMAKSIAENGIKPVRFMRKAAEQAMKELPEEAEKALSKDIEQIIFKNLQKTKNLKVTLT